ncbi:DUF6443 domain-containing protein [Flavobacterium soli]|uniref:DUF6443 domain-containing protein n=1 Tax=Flavobacterium soli TaxID=344881 RepID=UPI00041DBDE1|nr:DUF6443 domain-containing protein [Flavobacterium soli]
MKKVIFLLFPLFSFAQTTTQNYIKNTIYKVPVTSTLSVPNANKTETVTYYDGLGRPKQLVNGRASNNGRDILTHISYDNLGRQSKDFLPYESANTTLAYDPSAESNTLDFYDTTQYENTLNPYSEKKYEDSPLNRVLKEGAPGNDWMLPITSSDPDHSVRYSYLVNTEQDEVKMFAATATSPSAGLYNISLSNYNYYPAGRLYKTVMKNENWILADGKNNTSEEFKNKSGEVVLKRTYNENIAHDTYYVNDQFGNLTYVLPPLANGSITNPVLEGVCYQYKYDSRNRLVERKLPGKQWEFIVYDKLDRVVATGPANSPFSNITASGWLITKYDAYNRPILTAWKEATVTSSTRNTLQGIYNGAAATTISEKRTTSATVNSTVNGVAFNYTNVAEPTVGYHVLTVIYYDNYSFPNAPVTFSVMWDGTTEQVHYNNTDKKPKGLATGSWVRVLETSTMYKNELSYMLYDRKASVVMSHKVNYLGGYTRALTKYDFEGKVLQTQTLHKRLAGTSQELEVNDYFTYTDQGRLLEQRHKVNGGTEELITKNEYDALGQLKNKRVGGLLTGQGLQKVDFTYNIRGWLKGINNTQSFTESGSPTDLFAFKIGYNEVEGTTTPLYNGNIGETYWKTHPENVLRKYSYEYDDLNRLTDAYYQKPGLTQSYTAAYNEEISYDKNGNIFHLYRNGYLDKDDGSVYPIDDLNYIYDTDSNVLRRVDDNSNSLDGFLDGNKNKAFNPTHKDYDFEYDANGNMTADWNKGIQGITYNHLNLPTRINFKVDAGQKFISYLYNALGQKVMKHVLNQSPNGEQQNVMTDYLDGYQYIATVLEFFPTAEGYVRVTNGNLFNYVYNYTDHLGNIRLSYTKEGTATRILEENHYYPFGMKHNYNREIRDWGGSPGTGGIYAIVEEVRRGNYQYKYNGKEYQDELGLNFYDYGARNYDPAIGRWMNIDPLAETSRRFSPYTYALNNPVYFIDPDGMVSKAFFENILNNMTGTEFHWTAKNNGTQFAGSEDGGIYSQDDQEDPKKKRTNSGKGEKAPTLDQANEHYRNGGGDPYYVDASTVDLNFLHTKTKNWIVGKTYLIRTLLNSQQGKVFGKLLVTYKGNNQVEIVANTYDFNMEFSNPLKVSEFLSPRNFLTALGEVYAGEGTPFDFVFKGLNTIEAPSIIPQPYLYKQYP